MTGGAVPCHQLHASDTAAMSVGNEAGCGPHTDQAMYIWLSTGRGFGF